MIDGPGPAGRFEYHAYDPQKVLLDPYAPKRQRHHVRGIWREYWVWPHPDHYIWGATAGMIKNFYDRMYAVP